MKTTLLAMTMIVSLSTAAVWGQTGGEPKKDAPKPPPRSASSIRAVLDKPVPELDWDELTLESVVEWLRDQGPINVVVQWRALEAEGIGPDTPVTLSVRNATVGEVLNDTLDYLPEGGEVRYRGIGSTLRISTKADFNRKMYVRVYDVADLLTKVENFRDGPEIDLAQQQGGGGGGGGGNIGTSTGKIFGNSDSEEEDDEEQDEVDKMRLDELIALIQASIEPDSWELTRAGPGTIVGFNRSVVVRNSIEVHEQLGGPFVLK